MPQDPAVIQRQIEATRMELAATVDQLVDRVNPKRVAERQREQLTEKLHAVGSGEAALPAPLGKIAAFYGFGAATRADATGDTSTYHAVNAPRWERIGATAAVVLGLIVWLARRGD
ncbi:MAG TPA: DUF3618 domain-containing protein [Frankiaceae bacterium]